MSSRAGSTIVTFLVSIPVAAVGLMAVFGVPPLANVIAAPRGFGNFDAGGESQDSRRASSRNTDEWEEFDEAPSWDADTESLTDDRDTEPADDKDALGFSKFKDSSRRLQESADRASSGRSRLLAGRDSDREDRSSRLDDDQTAQKDHRPLEQDSQGNPSSAVPMTMKEALKKLNMLQVKTYHLQPGADPDTWLFVCLFTPGDDPRVIQRFEAESADPDQAVSEVLGQIDTWLAQRWKERQPVARNAR
ncbi:MAG: hypothetical protein DWH91_06400 [Planctomycetota bacterium]|nr:MAG: hypothetical protein DWH91_06400 [Planctomycetota bacterium]